jgi:Protein of unknown function (DUF2809)
MQYLKYYSMRLLLIINILAVILLGCFVRFSHVFAETFHHIAGCIFYEILWILVGAFFYLRTNRKLIPEGASKAIAIWVFLGTCGIEFLKLYQPPWLQAIRATLPGRLILATTFDWYNFPVYLIGSYLGWLWIKFFDAKLQKFRQKSTNTPDNLNS